MDKTLYEFVVLPIDKPTCNGRIYPRDVIEREIEKYKKQYINENRALVTLYSDSGSVNLKDAVALVKDVRIGIHNQMLVKIQLLETSASKVLLDENGKFNFSKYVVAPFGVGTLNENVVQIDFELVGFHIDLKNE